MLWAVLSMSKRLKSAIALFSFFFFFFLFQLFIHSDCMGQGGPCSLEEHTVCNMDGLAYRFGSSLPFLPVPWWCVEGGGGCWTGKYYIVHLPPPLLQLRGVGGRGRVFALPSWACVLSVLGTGVVISWGHGPQALSV